MKLWRVAFLEQGSRLFWARSALALDVRLRQQHSLGSWRGRYSKLSRACPPISDRILSRELKELEAAGLVRREQRPGLPPRTDYELTELGGLLKPMMGAMADWSLQNRTAVEPAQDGRGV